MPPFRETGFDRGLQVPEAHFIDGLEFAKQSLEIHDKIRASQFSGLSDIVSERSGELEYRISGLPERDKPTIRLALEGWLAVRCQRCLGEMKYRVRLDREFVLVPDESGIPDNEADDDAADYLVADHRIEIEGLVEEELLLSLPLSIHHEHECMQVREPQSEWVVNPFHKLEGLKKK